MRFHRFLPAIALAACLPLTAAISAPAHRADRILVKPRPGVVAPAMTTLHTAAKGQVLHTFSGIGRLQVVRVPEGETVAELIEHYRRSGLVEFAEPDYFVSLNATPNDPKFLDGTLWGLHNTGQANGTPDADIDAPEGWDVLTSASNIIVAVLDTGIRRTHEDLASNIWVHPIDGGHGFNAITGTNNPNDDEGHGTLVSGILGAVGNNGKGVAGVAWRVQLMAGKCFDNQRTGTVSWITACIDYARTNGARIINASFDSSAPSFALSNAIVSARDAGILFVTSAGNNNANIDLSPRYPSAFDLDNIVSVAYTTRSNTLGRFSNFGATNVDLAAPGAGMHSTFFVSDNFYLGASSLEGTSFAAPYVSGALALMLAKFPGETHHQIIARLLTATDPVPALAGKCATGGLLNLRRALSPPLVLTALPVGPGAPWQWQLAAGPRRLCVIEAATDLPNWSPIFTNTTSDAGVFRFTDVDSPNLLHRFYRATAAP